MPARVRRGFADSGAIQLHYRTAAPDAPTGKPPLVMFHGSPGSSLGIEGLIASIGESRRVIAFDTPGQGDSPLPRHDVTMVDLAAIAATALDGMGADCARIDAWGTHTGARIAAELAIQAPGRVRRLILDGMRRGPSPFWEEYAEQVDLSRYIDEDGTQFHKAWIRTRDQFLWFPWYRKSAETMRAQKLPPPAVMHERAMDIFKGILGAHVPYRLAVLYPSEQRLPLIRVPTLSTCAPKDGPFGDIEYVAKLIPGAESMPHPQQATMGTATDAEIVALCAMLTGWLDR